MSQFKQWLPALCTALVAALMAGCAAGLAVEAMEFQAPWAQVYLLSLAAALSVQLARRGGGWLLGVLGVLVLALGALCAAFLPQIAALVRAVPEMETEELLARYATAGRGIALLCALVLSVLFSGLLRAPSCAPFALMVMLTAVICALAVNEEISLWMALPGLAAGVAAFGLNSDGRRSGVRPALMLPGLLLAAFALVLVPAGRTTWAPLEDLAQRIRSVVEDYIRFTEERVAFSINEKGFDRAGMIGTDVVAMLGGPATPSEDEVMRVQTDADLLLRGTIKRSYTGYSWVDDQIKARYLYYDFTHRGIRQEVFGADAGKVEGFEEAQVSVEMLGSGTSTLFVPALMTDFKMGLADAVYYNSTGEIFLTRDVAAGDAYSFEASLPASDEALISAVEARQDVEDARYAEMLSNYTALPQGIDAQVYALAVELTQNSANAAQKAFAIERYLAENYHYTLEGGYPEGNADFVSWFLLESGEGYCSYFASAMAVMCRIAGLPTRYVEGYYVQAQPGGETLVTGQNAHAWVEVYFNGLGWVAFDPTARSVQAHGGEDGMNDQAGEPQRSAVEQAGQERPEDDDIGTADSPEGDDSDMHSGDASAEDTPAPDSSGLNNPEDTPAPSPTPPDGQMPPEDSPSPTPSNGQDMEDTPTPTPPAPDSGNEPSPTPSADPFAGENAPNPPQDPPQNEDHSSRWWLWLILGVLLVLLIALAVWWARRRLIHTDPLTLSAQAENAQAAALVLYRAMLTLLAQLGQVPLSGETPQAFAQRATLNMPNRDFERFAAALARSCYSGRDLSEGTVETGKSAYRQFLNAMRRSERLRFRLRCMFRGIGDVQRIP